LCKVWIDAKKFVSFDICITLSCLMSRPTRYQYLPTSVSWIKNLLERVWTMSEKSINLKFVQHKCKKIQRELDIFKYFGPWVVLFLYSQWEWSIVQVFYFYVCNPNNMPNILKCKWDSVSMVSLWIFFSFHAYNVLNYQLCICKLYFFAIFNDCIKAKIKEKELSKILPWFEID